MGNESESNIGLINDDQSIANYRPPSQKKGIIIISSLGVIFMLLFSAYNTAQNMISQIYSQNLKLSYLGRLTLLFIYLFLGFSNILAGSILSKMSLKMGMFSSAFGYVLFLGAGVMACACEHSENEPKPDYFFCSEGIIVSVNLICAAILGFTACIIWVAQPGYTTLLCDPANKAKFFGIFWALLQSSQILGNMFSALALSQMSHMLYFLILFFVALGSTFLFLLLPNIKKTAVEEKPLKEKIEEFFICFKRKEMQIFSFFCALSGMAPGFFAGFLFTIVENCVEGNDSEINKYTAWVFVCLGTFEFAGGMLISWIGDKFNKYVIAGGATMIIEMGLLLSLISYYEKSYLLCFFTAACWGAGECISNSIIGSILSTDMGNKLEGFAVYKLTQSIGCLLTLLLTIVLDGKSPYILILILAGCQILSTLSIVWLKGEKKTN